MKTGIYEWADEGLGIENGCEHGCLYCYAAEKKTRLGLVESREAWLQPAPCATLRLPKGPRVMFPTTHDITPRNLSRCEAVIHTLLRGGQKVLVVSKPHFACVERLVEGLGPWLDRVEFRFSIGSIDRACLRWWEPQAPSPAERLYCIDYAAHHGFTVSVSAEPVLDWGGLMQLVTLCLGAGADHVWVGLLNQWERRLAHLSDEARSAAPYEILRCQQSNRIGIYEMWTGLRKLYGEKVKPKDSIQRLVAQVGAAVEEPKT